MRKLVIILLALGLMFSCAQAKETKKVEQSKVDKVSQQINEILKKNDMAMDARMVITRDGAVPQIMVVPLEKKEQKKK